MSPVLIAGLAIMGAAIVRDSIHELHRERGHYHLGRSFRLAIVVCALTIPLINDWHPAFAPARDALPAYRIPHGAI